jgi:type IV secretory pathway VirB10-like protein
MFSKPLAFGLLALGCVTAAAGGAYLATRHTAADVPAATRTAAPPSTAPSTPATEKPVAETEAAVNAEEPAPEAPAPSSPKSSVGAATSSAAAPVRRSVPDKPKVNRSSDAPPRSRPAREAAPAAATAEAPAPAAPPSVTPAPVELPKPAEPQPEPPHVPQFEELVVPSSSVLGLQMETALSSERARLEDRVEARVTRDVMVNGRVAIPAGSRVLGSVTLVNRGGKLKESARLGIRFHTLVLADGTDVALQTEPFYRDGESPAGESAKKIGGAAAVGAILGAIIGGGKGAVVGGGTGAGAGTAAVMAGDRNPATVASGSIVSVRLSAPVTIQVEKREQQ